MKLEGKFDSAAWSETVQQTIERARAGNMPLGAQQIGQLARTLAPELDKLQNVGAAERAGLFMEAVLRSASYDEMLALLAARHGRGADDIRRDLVGALRDLSRGPVRAADEPVAIELATIFEKPGLGKVSMAVEDITRVPAEVSIVPQLSSGDPAKGGGGRGGIALAWERRAKQQDEVTNGGATEMIRAVNLYDQERGRDYLPHGTTVVAPTGLEDRSIGPAMLLHIASVPASELTYKPMHQYPDEEAFKAHQNARLSFVEDMLRRALFSLRRAVGRDPVLEPSPEHPIRVTLPALCTGPKGAVDFEECGLVMGRVLREFQKENPGYEFVVALWDDGRDPLTFRDKKAAFADAFVNDALQDKQAAQYEPNSVILNKLTHGLDRLADPGKGKTLDDAYLEAKLGEWKDNFLEKLGKLDARSIADRSLGITHFGDRVQAEVFWQLHKLVQIPALSGAGGEGLADVTMARMKAALEQPGLRDKLFDVIKHQLAGVAGKKGAFAGDDKMHEVFTAAIAYTLQETRYRHLESFNEQKERALAGVAGRVAELEEALAGKVDGAAYEKLKQQLQAAEENARAFKKSSDTFEREVKKLVGDNRELQGKVATLAEALRDEKALANRYRMSAESVQVSSYRAPAARVG